MIYQYENGVSLVVITLWVIKYYKKVLKILHYVAGVFEEEKLS